MAGAALLFAAICASTGCGHHFEVRMPEHFVELDASAQERAGYALRATTAEGVVLAVREIANEEHGSREFWVDAIRNRLRRAGGYALLEERDVSLASGDSARQLRFGRDEAGRPYAYWLTIAVRSDVIILIEAGGRRDAFEAREAALTQAIASVRLR